jgi:hypothetical protein
VFQRWTNPSHPQTLQIAVFLLYASAVFSVLFGWAFTPIGLLVTAGSLFGGLGIANDKRWGYNLGLAISVLGLLPFVWLAASDGIGELLDLTILIGMIFPVARFALLVHPMSRDYQRIWFE